MPRLKIRLRTLLILVALVAIAMGAIVAVRKMGQRARHFTNQAELFADLETSMRGAAAQADDLSKQKAKYAEMAIAIRSKIGPASTAPGSRDEFEKSLRAETARLHAELKEDQDQVQQKVRKAEFFGRMRRKYEYAASHPWLRVQPDPPWPGLGPEADAFFRQTFPAVR